MCHSLRTMKIGIDEPNQDEVYVNFLENMIQKIKENPYTHPFTLIVSERFYIQNAVRFMQLVEEDS